VLEIGIVKEWIRSYLNATRGRGWEYPPYDMTHLQLFFADCLDSLHLSSIKASKVRLIIVQTPYAQVETVHSADQCYIIFDQGFREVLHILNKEYRYACRLEDASEELDHDAPPPRWLRVMYANRFLSLGRNNEALVNALFARDATPSPSFPDFSQEEIDELSRWGFVQEAFTIAHELAHCRLDESHGILAHGLASSFNELVREAAVRWDAREAERTGLKAKFDADMFAAIDAAVSGFGANNDHVSPEYLDMAAKRFKETYTTQLQATLQDESREAQLDWLLREGNPIGEEVLSDYFAMYFVTRLLGDRFLPFDECVLACTLASMHIVTWRSITTLAATLYASSADGVRELFRGVAIRHNFLVFTGLGLSHFDHLSGLYRTNLEGDDFIRAQDERKGALYARLGSLDDNHRKWIHNRAVLAIRHVLEHANEVAANEKLSAIANSSDFPDMIAATARIGYRKFEWTF
jgi:hypothetical protein